MGKMKGLCHSCLTTDVEVINDKGQIICMTCFHNKQRQSQENKDITDPPSLEKLKKKWQK